MVIVLLGGNPLGSANTSLLSLIISSISPLCWSVNSSPLVPIPPKSSFSIFQHIDTVAISFSFFKDWGLTIFLARTGPLLCVSFDLDP